MGAIVCHRDQHPTRETGSMLASGAGTPAPGRPAARATMERETGFEPATPSLEGWRSTAELFPPIDVRGRARSARARVEHVVGRGGFEPPKAYASRFTVCPLWPLGYLPEPAGMRWNPRPL